MNNKELISNSVDARCRKFNIKLHLGVFIAADIFISAMVIFLFWDYHEEMTKALLWCNILFAIAYLPMSVYHAVKLRSLVKKCDTYIISDTYLTDYRSVGFMGHTCFCVEVTDENGKTVKHDTDSIYTMRGTLARFDEWHNKRAKVAYDPESERVIVCSLI